MKLTIEWEGGSKHIFHSAPSMYIENKDKHKMKSIHIEESPVKELTDAIETLENLLDIANNGMKEGYKTMNSHFVIEEIKQAILEIRKAQSE